MSVFRQFTFAICAALLLVGCKVEVYDKLSQRDANEMTALLLLAGIDAKRTSHKDGTFAVEVAEDDFAQAVVLISESGLPKPEFASITDILNDDRLIASPAEERARLNYGLSQELSRTVSEIEGVVSARVHLAVPRNDPLGKGTARATASVALHHRRKFDTDEMVPRIKTLIANAVDGLDEGNVSIALFPTAKPKEENSDDGGEIRLNQGPPSDPPPQVLTPAGLVDGRIGPAVAAVLIGGLIVLIVAGRALVTGRRRRSAAPSER